MDAVFLFLLLVVPLCGEAWRSSSEERRQVREVRRGAGVHYHAKRHMLPSEPEAKKRPSLPMRNRENRKKVNLKPSGHLKPLKEDDIDNDEVVSVAIGPPPMRPMYEKLNWKHSSRLAQNGNSSVNPHHNCSQGQGATTMVKDVLSQLGREFLTHSVSEDFVFGQYVGNVMKNLTSELKVMMQHEVLELVMKYQKMSRGEVVAPKPKPDESAMASKDAKIKTAFNDTEDNWPDFSNLAKIVG